MKNLSEVEESAGFVNKYMEPGISRGVVISSIEGVELGNNKSLGIKVTIQNKEGQTCDNVYWMNDIVGEGKEKSAQDVSLPQLKKIAHEAGCLDAFNAINLTETDNVAWTLALGVKLNTLLVNKTLDVCLWGKINSYDGKTFVKAIFGVGNFCEAPETTPTTLKFDPTNVKHLPVIPTAVAAASPGRSSW